jgi:hypothetical protein
MVNLAAASYPVPAQLLSAEGAFIAFVAGVLIDKMGIGGPKVSFITDRIAFICWVAVAAVGFHQAGISELLVGTVTGIFEWLGDLWDVPLWRGGANIAPQILGAVVAMVALGAMLPNRLSRWLGRWVTIQFSHFKQAGPGATMPATGTTRGAAPAAGGGKGILGRVFSGQINYGMVAVAFLVVTASTTVGGWVGGFIDHGVNLCVASVAWATNPIITSVAAS